jgi:hypothetical protein
MTDVLPGMAPVPLSPPCLPITGDSHAHLLTPLERLAGDLGYTVQYRPIYGATGGWCDSQGMNIVVDADKPANARGSPVKRPLPAAPRRHRRLMAE